MKLENNGQMKRLFNSYVRGRVKSTNSKAWNKKEFIPFVDERDHLGNLIDSEIRTQLGGTSYIKRRVTINTKRSSINFKENDVEVKSDVPQRWLDTAGGRIAAVLNSDNGSQEVLSPGPKGEIMHFATTKVS